jgi:hypothetical protein
MAIATARTQPERELTHGHGEHRPRADPLGGAVAGVTILGFALAAYGLGAKSTWLDEAVSTDHARPGLSSLWTVITSHDPNMGFSLEDYRAATHYVLAHERPGDGAVYYPAGSG